MILPSFPANLYKSTLYASCTTFQRKFGYFNKAVPKGSENTARYARFCAYNHNLRLSLGAFFCYHICIQGARASLISFVFLFRRRNNEQRNFPS